MTLQLRSPLVAVFAFLMMVAMIGFAQPALAACAQGTTKTTSSSQSTIDNRTAYWTTGSTLTGGGPCVDINVTNQNRSTSVTGAYKSPTFGMWIAGANGWTFGVQYSLVAVITNLQGSGIEYRTGSAVGSTVQYQSS